MRELSTFLSNSEKKVNKQKKGVFLLNDSFRSSVADLHWITIAWNKTLQAPDQTEMSHPEVPGFLESTTPRDLLRDTIMPTELNLDPAPCCGNALSSSRGS